MSGSGAVDNPVDDWGYGGRVGDRALQAPFRTRFPVDHGGQPVEDHSALTSTDAQLSTIPSPYYDSYFFQLLEGSPVQCSPRRLGR